MLEKLIREIERVLSDQYGAEYEVHIGDGIANPTGPCFMIVPLRQNKESCLGDSYRLTQSFDIVYIPQKANDILGCAAVLAGLYDQLEFISVLGERVRGGSMGGEIKNNILHFYINYSLFTAREETNDNHMQAAEICVGKGENIWEKQ